MSLLDLNKIADTLYRRLSTATVQQYTPTTPSGGDDGWMRPYPFAPVRLVNGD